MINKRKNYWIKIKLSWSVITLFQALDEAGRILYFIHSGQAGTINPQAVFPTNTQIIEYKF
jgi:hypothetical protein